MVADSDSAAGELALVAEAVALENQICELESYDTAGSFRRLMRTIGHRRRIGRLRRVALRAAAILVLPLLVSTSILGWYTIEPVRAEITVAPGTVTSFELPDSSKVWLNAGSVLRYPERFDSDVREVTLTGEGYFEVQSDPDHPFLVSTSSGVSVMAYGTHFNVSTGDGNVQAILEQGSVKMLDRHRRQIEIRPGEQAVYNGTTLGITVGRVNLYEKLAWKDGRIVFRNAPLSEVFQRLSQRFNVDIVLHDPAGLSDKYRARVTFRDETIQQIFSYLEIAAPLSWKLSRPTQMADNTLTRQRIDVWLGQ